MTNAPKVSVVIPTYNRKKLLERALGSVLGQTYGEWEAIVVDDASSDGTESAVRGLSDERLRFIRKPVSRGPAAARNTGIAASRGEAVAFLDSDDEWLPDKLEKQMRVFQKSSPEVGVVYTGTLRHFNGKTYRIPSPAVKIRDGDVFSSILRGVYLVPTPAAAVKREALLAAGSFDETLPALEEWDLWIRLAKINRFVHIPEPLTISHFTPGSMSADRMLFYRASLLIFRKHRKEFLRSPRALSAVLWRMGRLRVGHFIKRSKEPDSR